MAGQRDLALGVFPGLRVMERMELSPLLVSTPAIPDAAELY